MSRQSTYQIQKQTNSTVSFANDILQQKKINRNKLNTSAVDIQSQSRARIGEPINSGAGFDFSKVPIQAKLKIGQPNDKYEQEADRVAVQVMRMPDPRSTSSAGNLLLTNRTIPRSESIQRACALCSEDEELIQAKATGEVSPYVTPAISSGIQSLQGGGRPLSGSERNFFEPRLGYDFGQVRVHTNEMAAQTANSIGARAFTFGQDVVFAKNEYQPNTISGKHLLAHELTHTLQQSIAVRPVVMRATAEDCTKKGKTNSDLLAVHDEARKLLKIAIDKTAKRDKRDERTAEVKAALLKWFKIDLDSKVNLFQNVRAFLHVINAMDSTFNGSDGVAYECSENGLFEVCKPGRNAVTLSNIHICPDWWDLPKDRKPIVLIHEWTHKFGKGVNRVFETYCWDKEFAKLPRDERVKMPDAYEGYISLLSQGTGTC